jgi:hypothetical protein
MRGGSLPTSLGKRIVRFFFRWMEREAEPGGDLVRLRIAWPS